MSELDTRKVIEMLLAQAINALLRAIAKERGVAVEELTVQEVLDYLHASQTQACDAHLSKRGEHDETQRRLCM